MSDKQHLYLVDGSAYIFRAYHRLPPLTNPQGDAGGRGLRLHHDAVEAGRRPRQGRRADAPRGDPRQGRDSFRNDLYDQYKANRPPPPEDLKPQFPLIRDATRAFSLPCIEEDDLEADDLIASYARKPRAAGWDVTIVSSDKDLMQLVGRCAEPHDGHRGRLHRHARHDEEPADRHPRGGREVRRRRPSWSATCSR